MAHGVFRDNQMGSARVDWTGWTNGVFTVRGIAPKKGNNSYWVIDCQCGKSKFVRADAIKRLRSCGCLKSELMQAAKIKHSMTGSPTYQVWVSMRQRCRNPNAQNFRRWGGRGITVCDRWDSFENFYQDMGEKPKGLSIDRIDNDGNYEPDNCRWATRQDQANNRNTTGLHLYKGSLLTISELEKLSQAGNVYSRIRAGWSVENAVDKPLVYRG